ncbi:hypothetical protein ACFL1D_02670, partial [Candidatus Omnitrophota bacterium]
MLKTFLIILITLVFVISAFSAGHQVSRLNLYLREAKTMNTQLHEQLVQALQEREVVKERLGQGVKPSDNLRLSQAGRQQQAEPSGNAEIIKKALIDAQERVRQLNESLNQIKTEKAVLKDENFSMSQRLANTTRELISVTQDLKATEQKLSDIKETQVLALENEVIELKKSAESKNLEFAKLTNELTALESDYADLIQGNRSLEKTVKGLETEKTSLEVKLFGLQKEIEEQAIPMRKLQDNLGELNAVLTEKEKQVKLLESELAKFNLARSAQEEKLA